jgi:hypothetical protein
MQEFSRIALKEWAFVVQALSEGFQLLLLRKGGIVEDSGEFQLTSREFFLYPTWEHQQETMLQPRYAAAFRLMKPLPPGELLLKNYAAVTDVWPASDLPRTLELSSEFVWNQSFLEKRYAYKPELPLSILALRVYRLPNALRLPVLDRYAGCRSWVELDRDLPTAGAVPVLDDSEFERRRGMLRERLASASVVSSR